MCLNALTHLSRLSAWQHSVSPNAWLIAGTSLRSPATPEAQAEQH